MDCYGRLYGRKEECAKCELADYCKDAGDPPLISSINIDKVPCAAKKEPEQEIEHPKYTLSQLAELLRIVIDLEDPRIRNILRLKISNPDISLSKIGKRYNISKQAIEKDIKLAIKYCPALSVVLCNRPLYNRWRKEQRHMASGAIPRRRVKYQNPMLQLTFDFGCEIKEGRENIRERGVS